ncbi:MAG: glucose-6-phosphate dehydrogenase (coenzyme-F420) [Candidatus Dormibacteraeota bacterium]|nr:glucose-6-phosphate dehydrogenase (coenzyme-F420) [Candidatus Dormibacteraeota bacterium]
MKHPLRLGWKASAEQFGPRPLLELGVLAEEVGFDSVWISDHFQAWRHTDGHAPFSLSWLAALGERTRRVTMGTSVLTPTFRYHPSVIAHAFSTLGSLYPRRMILGVGTGESMNEVPVIGIEWPEFRERFRRLSEAVRLIRLLMTEEEVQFEGEYYQVKGATVYDRPEQPVPIYVGASGEVAAKFAGKKADGFICTSGKGPELYREKLLPAVRAGAEAAGRDFEAIEKMIEVKVAYDHDRDRAVADTRIWAALALPPEDKANIHSPREMEARAAKVEHPESRWIVSTDPDEHIERIAPYLDLGFTHLVFHAPGDDQERFLRTYAAEILPRLRARWG